MTRYLILLAVASLLTAAAPDTAPSPAPLKLVETISPQGLQEVSPGQIVSTAVIVKPDSGILAGDIILDWKGEQRKFTRGQVIQPGGETGVAGVPQEIFCEPVHDSSVGKPATGQPAPATTVALPPTHSATRYCLFDTDKDGTFDHAFLVGAKGEGRAPFVIPPVEYGRIEGRRLADDSVLRLRYVGPAGSPDTIAFDLEAFAIGTMRNVPHPRTFVPTAKLPAYAIIGVAVVTVLTYDPKTHVATIRMDHDLAPGYIVLPDLAHAY